MRQVLVIKYDNRGSSHCHLVSFSDLVLQSISHLDLKWNAFVYRCLHLITCHTLCEQGCLIN